MNDNAKKWVAALRSGEYKQTTGRLHSEDGFCCLGVACVVFIKNGGHLRVTPSGDSGAFLYDGRNGCLPESVRDWLGMRDLHGLLDDGRVDLTKVNDAGTSFQAIADIIETQTELFKEETK